MDNLLFEKFFLRFYFMQTLLNQLDECQFVWAELKSKVDELKTLLIVKQPEQTSQMEEELIVLQKQMNELKRNLLILISTRKTTVVILAKSQRIIEWIQLTSKRMNKPFVGVEVRFFVGKCVNRSILSIVKNFFRTKFRNNWKKNSEKLILLNKIRI